MKALLAFVTGTVAGIGATVLVLHAWGARPVPWVTVPAETHRPATPLPAGTPLPPGSAAPPSVAPRPAPSVPADEPAAPPASLSPHIQPAPDGTAPVAEVPMAPPAVGVGDFDYLVGRRLTMPVDGVSLSQVRDTFAEMRGTRVHEAVDVLAPRGTPVRATDDGVVRKLFDSRAGGLTVYQFDPGERYAYYYAHLDRYADGLAEGRSVRKGDLIGYVGVTGNAPKDTPHLHFAVFRLGPEKQWWKGTAVNPYPVWALSARSN